MINGIAVTIDYYLAKLCIIFATVVIVFPIITGDMNILFPVILAVLVVAKHYTEKYIAAEYIRRYGGDSTWQDLP